MASIIAAARSNLKRDEKHEGDGEVGDESDVKGGSFEDGSGKENSDSESESESESDSSDDEVDDAQHATVM